MKVFVVHHTNFDYKPGHMSLCCNGVYTKWEDAFRAALEDLAQMLYENDEETEEEEADVYIDKILAKLPTTQKEMEDLLPERGCVWDFEVGESAQWWDGDDIGSQLTSVSCETVKNEIEKTIVE